MAYGINIFDAKGNSTISGLTTEFVIETIRPSTSGSKSYTLKEGESLRITRFFGFSPGVGANSITGASVSGGTVSWTTEHIPHTTFPLVDAILVTKVVS